MGDVRFNEGWLDQPLRWRAPRRIFVCAHGDLFHEAVPDEWIDRVFAVMGECRQHTFQVLTKRPERMREYLDERCKGRPLMPSIGGGLLGYHPFNCEVMPPENIWLGTSIEDQATADARIPHLLATPAAARFVSAEPLLGALDLRITQARGSSRVLNALTGASFSETSLSALPRGPGLDLVIVGGESGPRARPMHPDWVRSLRDQCVSAGVSFHFKKRGEWAPAIGIAVTHRWIGNNYLHKFNGGPVVGPGMARIGKRAAGRLLDGRTWDEMPGGA